MKLRISPFLFISLVTAVALVGFALQVLIRYSNSRTLSFPTDTIRAKEFVTDPPAGVDVDRLPDYQVIAWEFGWPQVYEYSSNDNEMKDLLATVSPHVVAESKQVFAVNEPIKLPDGGTWEVLYILVKQPRNRKSGPLENRIFDTELNELDIDEFERFPNEFSEKYKVSSSMLTSPSQFPMGEICLVMDTTNGGIDNIVDVSFHDAKTGWQLIGNKSSMLGDLAIISFESTSWHAGPAAFWFEFNGDVVESFDLAPKVGEVIQVGDSEIKIIEIARKEEDGWVVDTPYGRHADQTGPGNVSQSTRGVIYFEVRDADSFERPIFQTDSGTAFVQGSSTSSDSMNFKFANPIEEIENIKLNYRPSRKRVAIRIPYIPGMPEENRNLDDFLELRIPHFAQGGTYSIHQQIQLMLQTMPTWKRPASRMISNEFQIEDTTIGQAMNDSKFLDQNLGQGFFVAIDRKSGWAVSREAPTGWFLKRRYSLLGYLAMLYLVPRNLLISYFAIAIPFFIFSFARAMRFNKFVAERGYHDWKLTWAWRYWMRFGKRAWAIPPADELAVIPGVDPTKYSSVVKFMKARRL